MLPRHFYPGILAYAISKKQERASGRDGGIQLAQTAGGGIAGIGKMFAATLFLGLVQCIKSLFAHIHLTTHFKARWMSTQQAQRYCLYGTDIERHVFTGGPVSPCCTLYKFAAVIKQADGETIQLGLCGLFDH